MTRGFEIFRAVLDAFAARPDIRQARAGGQVRDIAVRAGDPLRIAVRGRAGVGVTSVIAALGRTMAVQDGPGHVLIEMAVPGGTLDADVDVVVIAEALKPEDRAVLEKSDAPKVLVLNKADLTDAGATRGPWSAAMERCRGYRAETGVVTLPLSAHVPMAQLDADMVAALRLLVEDPADTGSVDAFVTSAHQVPVSMRQRLLRELDLYPIGCAVGALRQAPELGETALTALLADLSGISPVVAAIRSAETLGWYGRMRAIIGDLHRLAVTGELSAALDSFLVSDELVVATMQCAVDAAAAVGATVDNGDRPSDHYWRAQRWQQFAGGPVNRMFEAVGTDITRGSLRLWRMAGGAG